MKEITLTKGLIALVDDEDFDKVNKYSWYTNIKSKYATPYAYRKAWLPQEKKYANIAMHRFVLDIGGKHLAVDHINGNTLDNRKENLRVSTHAQNMMNTRIRRGKKYKGVGYFGANKNLKKHWRAYIQVDNKHVSLGYYATEVEAAYAYDKAAKEHFSIYAKLNFPL